MSKTKKSINPAEYGRWHEITEADTENCNPSKRGNRLSLVSIHQLETNKKKTLPETHIQILQKQQNENIKDKVTFNDDESLKGLDTVIKRLKEKALNNYVHELDDTETKSENDDNERYELDDIGKSVLEGLTDSEFLDQLEKELELEADKLQNTSK
ncbi:MAG: hypothetical protein H8E98_02465 [Bacteroidetes bacterium]|nr:hypothetical protein [Bacteroidota bacterium]